MRTQKHTRAHADHCVLQKPECNLMAYIPSDAKRLRSTLVLELEAADMAKAHLQEEFRVKWKPVVSQATYLPKNPYFTPGLEKLAALVYCSPRHFILAR